MKIEKAEPRYSASIVRTLQSLPYWYVQSARISKIVVDSDPSVRVQMAMYRHGTRDILVYPGIGSLLRRCLSHELAHGFDDAEPDGPAHRFSRTEEWSHIHKQQRQFEIQKYRDDPKEYFADMASKVVLLGETKVGLLYPLEVSYMLQRVFPVLVAECHKE